MTRGLSMDLRERVLAAVEGGLSCRQAAARFGVSASSAIRWCARWRLEGDARPRRRGGDRRSQRIEAWAGMILGLWEGARDMTLVEYQAALAAKGARFGIGTLWRFFDRHRLTLKKRLGTRPNRSGRMCDASDRLGLTARSISTRRG
jgi:transposase